MGVLKGAVFFMADLMRQLSLPCEIDFMAISSYGEGTDSSGVVRILKDLDSNITDRHVLILEDIIDTGLTLSYLMRNLGAREPASLEVCALLVKHGRRETDVPVKYVGFEIPEPVRRRLRPRLRGALPQLAARSGSGAQNRRKKQGKPHSDAVTTGESTVLPWRWRSCESLFP